MASYSRQLIRKNKMRFSAWVGSMTIGLLACSSQPAQEVRVEKTKGDLSIPGTQPLDEFFSSKFSPTSPGGVVLAMIGDSVIFSKGYGLADITTKEPITSQTLFNIGSVSKTFVSNAILILRDQGKLSLLDSLPKYFPNFKNKTIANRVQIQHLLTHTSGLPDIRYPWKDSVFYLTAKDQENWAPILKTNKLNFEPGSQHEYSNPGFNALALIVEQTSGMKWQSFVQDNILKPAGMHASTITDGPHPQSGVSHGYVFNKGQWLEKDYGEEPTFAAAGNGGVWSSIEELALYEKAMRKGTFLKKETLAESFEIKGYSNWSGKTPPFRGWSWAIGKTDTGLKTIWHDGWQGGFRAYYLAVPEKEWLIVVLTNCPHPVEEYSKRVLDFLQTGK
jgi:CubicO group peptidase (beta-lactamase class C family)